MPVTDCIYLDYARLSPMTPGAQRAVADFVRLAGAEGASPALDRFLRGGFNPADSASVNEFPGVAGWAGVADLKRSLRLLAGHRPDLPVLLAARSAVLMRFAARLLFHPCANVLITDLGWPDYHAILESEARRAGRTVTCVPLRDAILRDGTDRSAVVDRIRDEFVRRDCDGLFLPAVSNLGVRLPVKEIVRAAEDTRRVRFVAVDGAQEYCQAEADLKAEFCDIFLAGTHKWLGAGVPMGLGFYGRRQSQSFIETVLAHLLQAGEIDDPLLRFSAELEGRRDLHVSETVGLTSLFATQGAVQDAMAEGVCSPTRLPERLRNAAVVADLMAQEGWRPLVPDVELRSGILLLQAERPVTRQAEALAVRAAFHRQGVSLTAYEDGLIRLSMPYRPLDDADRSLLRNAARSVA